MGHAAITLRPVDTERDLEDWVRVKNAVVPNEPVSAEQMRASEEEGRLHLLAEFDGELAGSGIAARSHFTGSGFVAPRVLAEHRGRGIGTAILHALADHVRALDRGELISFVRRAVRAARRRLPARADEGDRGRAAADRARAVWPLALEGYSDMPLPGEVEFTLDEWRRC